MPYNSKVVKKVLSEFADKEKAAVAAAEKRKQELYKILPELFYIDRELSKTRLKLANDIFGSGGTASETAEKIERTKIGNQELQRKRAEILRNSNYPDDYTKPKYECALCKDSGYQGDDMCICLKKALSAEGLRYSGLNEMTKIQSFENFSLNYYSKEKDKLGKSAYKLMKSNLINCQKFVAEYKTPEFEKSQNKNLFFYGNTGLGKTHLSSAIARELIEKGFDVVYDTAQKIVYAFERERFSKTGDYDEDATERYLNCDLLIIDDLGTEYPGSMSVSTIFNIINSRLATNKNTIISTNMTYPQMQAKYEDRITSRIFGEYMILEFLGSDVRYSKKIDG